MSAERAKEDASIDLASETQVKTPERSYSPPQRMDYAKLMPDSDRMANLYQKQEGTRTPTKKRPAKDELITGVRQWQRESKGFKSGEKSRIDRIQGKLKKAIQDLELEGLDEAGKEIYHQTMKNQTMKGINSLGHLKPIEIEYDHPPA